jgi:hypothetical protein
MKKGNCVTTERQTLAAGVAFERVQCVRVKRIIGKKSEGCVVVGKPPPAPCGKGIARTQVIADVKSMKDFSRQ